MSLTPQTYLYDAVRSPFGRFGGGLASTKPDDLAAATLKAVVERTGLDPAAIDEVVLGSTVNRLCGSSLPLGASGGRILGTLAATMRTDGHRWGVAAICIGMGQGLAVVLKNEDSA